MTKAIKDLTDEELAKICQTNDCYGGCPLSHYSYDSNTPICVKDLIKQEVEVPK